MPHILHPKRGPLTTLSVRARKRLPAGGLLKGLNAGCQRRRGVKKDIALSDDVHVYQLLVKLLLATDFLWLTCLHGQCPQILKGQLALLIEGAIAFVKR